MTEDASTARQARCSSYIATSLDGYIARSDDSIDWLRSVESPGEDYGYAKFMEGVDAIVMGRRTYEVVLTLGAWPYTKPVVVMSRSPRALSKVEAQVHSTSAEPREIVSDLSVDGARRIYVDGGSVVTSFLRAGLIAEITLNRLPILLGGGVPLFGELDRETRLRHLETRAFTSGLVQSRYALEAADTQSR